ncbi:hypothetical protein [Streptomyces sp. NBC_00162]|uniref:hypothetical protein n=1 Tax=Streptomyces sp. NBC_00162 TaxID=2903629 RepID=UPI00214BB139|nr:hypothetical protein [Streptomyces sp. NBC_00162]UUU39141.1 hypothetical protein JIW86_10295 [Streptomyces sp. NBC_00162]
MAASNASKRLGFGLLGALLAAGLLRAACAGPDGQAHGKDPGELVLRHPGAVVSPARLETHGRWPTDPAGVTA